MTAGRDYKLGIFITVHDLDDFETDEKRLAWLKKELIGVALAENIRLENSINARKTSGVNAEYLGNIANETLVLQYAHDTARLIATGEPGNYKLDLFIQAKFVNPAQDVVEQLKGLLTSKLRICAHIRVYLPESDYTVEDDQVDIFNALEDELELDNRPPVCVSYHEAENEYRFRVPSEQEIFNAIADQFQ